MRPRASDTELFEARRIRAVYARREERGADRRYSYFEPAHLFQSQSLERAILRALRREGCRSLAGQRILDAGCGSGVWLENLTRYGARPADLVGIDLRLDAGRADGRARFALAAAHLLPFADGLFDLVCQVTMLSSVLDQTLRQRIASELLRVLKPAGILLWYDFTVNPLNPDVRGIDGNQLKALFPGTTMQVERVTLASPLTRLLASRAWTACALLEQLPWLRTHLLAVVRRSRAISAD